MPIHVSEAALEALLEPDPDRKCDAVLAMAEAWRQGHLATAGCGAAVRPIADAGRPGRPVLVAAGAVQPRRVGRSEGRSALVHAICHIEFTAINLALDCVYRFRDLPAAFYDDWVRVASEEAAHFALVRGHLVRLGHDYGDFPAHGLLWAMACRTADDVLQRMALVPRVLEARGLDASPPIMEKLKGVGDLEGVAILEIILRDEIGHVAVGDRWFRHFCAQRGLEPEAEYRRLIAAFDAPWPRPPLNVEARRSAGFSDAELAALMQPLVSGP